MQRSVRSRWPWMTGAALTVLAAVGLWAFWGWTHPTGDPGGKVMAQLTPTVTALPGYGTGSLPWVSQLPASLAASYVITMEPHRDSCDGMAGTQGWSQVVVQARFQWSTGFGNLVAYMDPRLAKLGWSVVQPRDPTGPPTGDWTKALSNGTRADLNISEAGPPVWEFVATAQPIGRAASGC